MLRLRLTERRHDRAGGTGSARHRPCGGGPSRLIPARRIACPFLPAATCGRLRHPAGEGDRRHVGFGTARFVGAARAGRGSRGRAVAVQPARRRGEGHQRARHRLSEAAAAPGERGNQRPLRFAAHRPGLSRLAERAGRSALRPGAEGDRHAARPPSGHGHRIARPARPRHQRRQRREHRRGCAGRGGRIPRRDRRGGHASRLRGLRGQSMSANSP